MGLAEHLDYSYPAPNTFQRGMQRFAASRFGSWLFSKGLHHVDVLLLGMSKGRASLPRLASGLPVITLTTIGAKSGQSRTTPLLGIPTGSGLAVIGTGWGMEPTPAWVYNLQTDPVATVEYRNHTVEVVARKPTAQEAGHIWDSAEKLYAGYALYPKRASHREIAVFVLEPSASD